VKTRYVRLELTADNNGRAIIGCLLSVLREDRHGEGNPDKYRHIKRVGIRKKKEREERIKKRVIEKKRYKGHALQIYPT
jgi:hypothetical protein